MNNQLLIHMLELADNNASQRSFGRMLNTLALKVSVDPELDDELTTDSFNPEYYTEKEIGRINQCLNFHITR